MNRQTLGIFAVLLAVVAVGLGVAVYWYMSGSDDEAAITGPGRAAEARGIIAEIEAARAAGGSPSTAAPALINAPEPAAGQAVEGGAIAVTPAPASGAPAASSAAPAGADAELDAAYERARELQAAGQLDDAQVLLFFGARRGHAPSAFAYAEINDPNHHSPETSLLAEPDAFQAFRWYTAAQDGGIDAATERLEALHEWAETAAAAGDSEADRLLLQWEQ